MQGSVKINNIGTDVDLGRITIEGSLDSEDVHCEILSCEEGTIRVINAKEVEGKLLKIGTDLFQREHNRQH